MAVINIDLRFVDQEHELERLADFLNILEKQLSNAIKKEQRHITHLRKKQKSNLDEIELSFYEQRLNDLINDTLPRFFRGPFICSLWAITESIILDVAAYIQKEQKQEIRIKDIRGDNMLDIAIKYFDHVLQFQLFDNGDIITRLEMIRVLRNSVAHCNGRLDALSNEKDLRKIKKWSKENIGISAYDNVVLSESFLRQNYKIINYALRNLLKRVRMEYK